MVIRRDSKANVKPSWKLKNFLGGIFIPICFTKPQGDRNLIDT